LRLNYQRELRILLMVVDKLLLHDRTKKQLQDFLKNPSHGLLISGQAGSGKRALAEYLSAELVGVSPDKLASYPYYVVITKPSDKQEIPVEAVRQLISSLKLNPAISNKGIVKRVVFISDAQLLSEEAQNALLKLLEEPPQSTVFILTVPTDKSVLPTIVSRLQKLAISPVSLEKAQHHFEGNYSNPDIASAWSLSQGAAGLMSAVLKDDKDHVLKSAVDSAKKLLKMSRYERVIFLDSLSGDREKLLEFIDGLNRVLAALQNSAINTGKDSLSKKIIISRRLVNQALEALGSNTSARLICLNLALKLPI